jgi:hypothetical protein
MHKTLSTHTTFLVAIFATAAATAYAMYLTYETHAGIDAVAIPAHYLKSSDPAAFLMRQGDD